MCALVPQSASVTLRVRSAPCVTRTVASASVGQMWSGETATRARRPPSILGLTAAEVRAVLSSVDWGVRWTWTTSRTGLCVLCRPPSVRLWPSGLAGSLLRSVDGTVHLLSGGIRTAVWPLSARPLGLPHVSTLLLQWTHGRLRAGDRPLHRLPGPQHRSSLWQVSQRTATPLTCDCSRL